MAKGKRGTEAEYAAKYPNLQIVEGSLGWDPLAAAGSGKQFVVVECKCGAKVRRYTSDLHTFKGCPVCKALLDKKVAAEKRATERAALAAFNANKVAPAPAIGN